MSRFEKISIERWNADCAIEGISESELKKRYDEILLPKQATASSAGCDFFMPYDLEFEPGSKVRIPTGIRWLTNEEDRRQVLMIFPRSGLGFKYGIRLSNTVGIIDSDYCGSDNEGHIIVSLENPSEETIYLPAGKPFAQGVVVIYDIPSGAESSEARNGGFGSTDEK